MVKELSAYPPKYAALAYSLFWVKGTWKTAGIWRALWPSLLFLKTGDKTPCKGNLTVPRLKKTFYYQRWGIGAKRNWANTPCGTNAYISGHLHIYCPSPKTLDLTILHKLIISLTRRYKDFCSGYSLGLHSFVGAPMYMKKIILIYKFLFPVNLSYISWILRPSQRF